MKRLLFFILICAFLWSNCYSELVFDARDNPLNSFVRQSRTTYNPTYDESKAIQMAYLAASSYCSPASIEAWNCKPCRSTNLNLVTVVQSRFGIFQGFVGFQPSFNAVVISFRGTSVMTDWLDNLTFIKTVPFQSMPDIEVHDGFYKAYRSVSDQAIVAMKKLLDGHSGSFVVVTGHSLGAAMATICAFDLYINHNISVEGLWTFGQPRVGNKAFAKKFVSLIGNHWRITHKNDIVPHVPPLLIGFVHSPIEVYYNSNCTKHKICNKDDGEDATCSNRCYPFHCRSIADHLMYLNVSLTKNAC